MTGGSFNRVGENDYRYRINNQQLYSLCGTSDASIFVKKQQLNYCEHLIRTPHSRIPKTLLFMTDNCFDFGQSFSLGLTTVERCVYVSISISFL